MVGKWIEFSAHEHTAEVMCIIQTCSPIVSLVTTPIVTFWEIDAPPPEALWICKMPRAAMERLRP